MNHSLVMQIYLTMLSKRKVTRDFLAEKFELSTRSVTRYIQTLMDASIPIISITGPNGGYTLADDYQVDDTLFSDADKLRIITALEETKNTFSDNKNMEIIEKLSGDKNINSNSNPNYLFNNDGIIIDSGSWNKTSGYRHKVNSIKKAIDQNLQIEINYVDRNHYTTARIINPYYLILKENIWYVYAYCNTRQDFRFFRISRIASIFIKTDTFTKIENIDISDALANSFDDCEEILLEIEFFSTVLEQIEEWLGLNAIYEEGVKYKAKAVVYNTNQLLAKVLSFGSSIKVISPQSLFLAVKKECNLMMTNL